MDIRNQRLVHPEELNSTPLQRTRHRSGITGLAFDATANSSTLSKLFAEFPVVIIPNFDIVHPKHAVQHAIETKGQPIRSKARPLPPQNLAAAKAKFAEMASSGIGIVPIARGLFLFRLCLNQTEPFKCAGTTAPQRGHDARSLLDPADFRPYRPVARKKIVP